MIRKKELIEGICDLNTDVTSLAIKINELNTRLEKLEKTSKSAAVQVKRTPGRPRKTA